jgi:hypothetical protein
MKHFISYSAISNSGTTIPDEFFWNGKEFCVNYKETYPIVFFSDEEVEEEASKAMQHLEDAGLEHLYQEPQFSFGIKLESEWAVCDK